MTLMFSYGSNLCRAQMLRRAPNAVSWGKFVLPEWKLVFRGVADVIPMEGAKVHGGVWKLSPADERNIDIYEGVRSRHYRKEYIPISGVEGEDWLMLYCMNSTGIFPPSEGYLNSIVEGYRDFKLPLRPLYAAVRESWDDKAPTYRERHRYRVKGRPRLAQRPPEPRNASGRVRNALADKQE